MRTSLTRLLLGLVLTSGAIHAQDIMDVTIPQIQQVAESDLAAGKLTSSLVGKKVRFVGVALASTVANRTTNDFRPLLTAGRRYVNFIQDTSATSFGGINVLTADRRNAADSQAVKNTLFDRIDSGAVVRITGTVSQFPTTPDGANQLTLANDAEVEILYQRSRPAPQPVTIADFYKLDGAAQTPQFATGAQYQGMLVELKNITVKESRVSTGNNGGRVTLVFVDEAGNEIRMRDQSGYYLARAAAQRISANQSSGATIQFMITPIYPGDMEVGAIADELPAIFSVRRPMAFPKSSEAVTVTFVGSPRTNPLDKSSAKICFSVDGKTAECVAATATNDTTFTATIPAQAAESIVTYWATIADDKGNKQISPRDTGTYKYFYVVIDNRVAIYDVQYTPNLSGTSGVVGFEVEVGGTVVADISDIPGDSGASSGPDPMVVIQESGGAWSGISLRVKNTNGEIIPELAALKRGERVLVRGTVIEDFGMTLLENATIVDKQAGTQTPGPVNLTTAQIGTKPDGQNREAEKWESMLVQFQEVTVTDDIADASNFGEYMIANTSEKENHATWTRVETDNSYTRYTTRTPDPEAGKRKIATGDQFLAITGVMVYTFNNFKLIPRKPGDYLTSGSAVRQTSIANATMAVVPNPTTGASVLQLTLPFATPVRVEVTNALGQPLQAVATEARLEEGTHRLQLPTDGLPSGTLFVRVTTPDGVATLPVVVLP
ncbi:MAG: T9SS C-terminal target domain-containing protein [Chlorobi bacterium CHB2]|nr:T9SS C-terminal target domain-containing protein [Chlorobi bacterium CHB2]